MDGSTIVCGEDDGEGGMTVWVDSNRLHDILRWVEWLKKKRFFGDGGAARLIVAYAEIAPVAAAVWRRSEAIDRERQRKKEEEEEEEEEPPTPRQKKMKLW